MEVGPARVAEWGHVLQGCRPCSGLYTKRKNKMRKKPFHHGASTKERDGALLLVLAVRRRERLMLAAIGGFGPLETVAMKC